MKTSGSANAIASIAAPAARNGDHDARCTGRTVIRPESEGPHGSDGGRAVAAPHQALSTADQSRFSLHVLRPCVAAYRIRSSATTSRLATSTFGRPGAEFVHVVVPSARRSTPKSVAA